MAIRHALLATDRRRTAKYVKAVAIKNKGRGVVALRDIPAYTMIGPYPGYLSNEVEYRHRLDTLQTTDKYVVSFFAVRGAVLDLGYVLDPGGPDGRLLPEFAGAVSPLVNEPGPRDPPTLVWVWNLPKRRLEQWTVRAVQKGDELTICYGLGGGYTRDYATSCVVRPGEVEPELHVVTRPRTRPIPYSTLGMAGVRKYLRLQS